jgi:CubicO group peptidase (beta-lactamase class C family)
VTDASPARTTDHRPAARDHTTERVDPAEVGLDPGAVAALVDRARREVDEGLLPSCQVALARHGHLVVSEAIGEATTTSRYVVFSVTKAITAGAVWLLVGDGALDVTTPVAELIPEFGTNGKDVVTVEQLLTHTAGFPFAPLDPRVDTTRERRLARYASWRLDWEPGSRFVYHPTSAHWVLGDVIAAVSGTDAPTFVRSRLAEPLGLTSLRLGEPPERQGDVLTLVDCGDPPSQEDLDALGVPGLTLDLLVGEVTNDALLAFNEPVVRSLGAPGAGAIATAADVAAYYQALLRNPDGLWEPSVLADGTARVRVDFPEPVLGQPSHRSLGLMIAGEGATASTRGFGFTCSPRAFGHGGAGGQIAWADPATGISFAYLTNGLDRNVVRQGRRTAGLSSRAASCSAPHN